MIFLILAVAFFLRAAGLWFGLPHLYHQDEPIIVNHALAYASLDFNPYFFKIPPLASYLLFGIYGIYFLWLKLWTGATVDRFAILFFKDPSSFYVLGRLFMGVFLGTATVAALYQLARRSFSRQGALYAAALLAVNFLHVRDSHYIYADIPMLFSMMMSFVAMSDHQKQGDQQSFLAACFWCGVAIAFKYVAAVMLLPFLFLMFAKRGFRHAVTALVLTGVVYLALNPFSLADFSFFIQEIRQQAAAESTMPLWHHWRYSVLEGMGIAGAAMGLIGLAWSLLQDSKWRWLWSFPFVYYAAMTVFSQPFERYAMPLIPFLCLGAGSLLSRIESGHLPAKRVLVITVFFLTLIPTLAKSMVLDHLMTVEDTRTSAKRWIEKNIPSGAVIALDDTAFSPRLLQTPRQLRQKIEAISEQDAHAEAKRKKIESMIVAQEGGPSYEVYYLNTLNIEKPSFTLWSPLLKSDNASLREAHVRYYVRHRSSQKKDDFFEKEILPKSEALARFSPYKDEGKIFTQDEWANTALPFRSQELYSRMCPGPVIEIYRLTTDA